MKKKLILLSLCLIMISGCGTKIPKLEDGKEAVVSFKDEKKISVDDLYNAMKENHALSTLIGLIDTTILEDKYKDKLDEAKEYTDSHMKQLEANYGDKLEEAIKQYTSLGSVEAYKKSVRLSWLQQQAIEDYAKKQIKDKEIEKYYKDEIVGDIKVNHILITAKVTDKMKPEEKKKAEETAKKEVEKIIETLKKTNKKDLEKTFSELAKKHSQDESTKSTGGSLGYINKGTLGSPYAELEKAAYKLKNGEFSTKVITTELGYHVILRTDSKAKPELKEVKDSILDTLSNKYLMENKTASTKALQEIRKEYGMEIHDKDIKTQYANHIQSLLMPQEENKQENK